ncbi:unnamed protein product [Closterium sp. Yama58-4]|nr:unnamed protein product [Closterium sp. Yama58-4]
MVHNTCDKLKQRYIEHGVNYAEDNELLTEFMEKHGAWDKREVTVEGMDGEGSPVKHTFKLHEEAIKGQKSKGDLESCITVTRQFAQEVVKHLLKRMESLDTLTGAKLFLPDAYPEGSVKRDRLCASWFQSLRTLFSAEKCVLPGVSWKKAGRELVPFTKMMAAQFKDQTFHAGLKHMLRKRAPKRKAERGTSGAASNEDEDDEDVVRRRTSKKGKACAALALSDDSDDDNRLDVRATVALESDNE